MSDTDRIKEICNDWEEYNRMLAHDPNERQNMQRSLIVELEHETAKLKALLRIGGRHG
jgi:hypothetical protein